jgi:hypothetical protein
MPETDLLGGAPKPRKKRAPAAAATEGDGAGARLVARWVDGYVAKFGLKPDLRRVGHLGRDLKELASQWGELEVADVIDRFFTSTDPAIVRCDYSVPAFLALVPRLRLPSGSGLNARTQERVNEVRKSMERRRE